VVTNTHTIEELREVVLPHGLVPGRQWCNKGTVESGVFCAVHAKDL
jgi:hypothetical protein